MEVEVQKDDWFRVLEKVTISWCCCDSVTMGNKPVKQEEKKDEYMLKVVPPLDRALVRWLNRDLERVHGFVPKNPHAIKPPEHYIEQMRLNGWLDLDLNDPDLAHLFK
ncbi:hypothetical protein AQUCO_07200021v1 [Aquilegia coerulea]|uniref:Uncharacterized protein n=1 Tax=Aquilegia coerulea TaxID=218851 RepID=A0A2G5C9Z3_AQUCA|nr:hypothetical protein AQUCO_07200021v1 [Aquilegia coerulea]